MASVSGANVQEILVFATGSAPSACSRKAGTVYVFASRSLFLGDERSSVAGATLPAHPRSIRTSRALRGVVLEPSTGRAHGTLGALAKDNLVMRRNVGLCVCSIIGPCGLQ